MLEKFRKKLAATKKSADEVSEFAESLINTIREPLIALDQDLRVVSASRSFYKFFKVKPEETVGQLIYDLGNKQWNIPKLRELLETILPQKTAFDSYEVEHDFDTIGRRTMLLNARQIERVLGKERIILLAIEDITERKEIEAGLEKTRKELEVIKKLADEAHEFADSVINTVREPLISLDQDLRVVTVSRSFYEFFKVKPEETVGQLIYDLGNKQWDIPELRELLETILPQKTAFDSYKVEHDFDTIGRRTMLLNARQIERVLGKERIILLAIEDITERVQAETVLKNSEEQYRRLFETADDGILFLEKSKLKIRHANPAITAMLGYSNEELIGNDMKGIGFPDKIGTFQEILQTLNKVGIAHHEDVAVQNKAGQTIYTDIYMADREILVQCNIRDITERKQAAQEKEKLQKQLIQAQKMEAIGTLAGGIAHDFNNILSAVIGYTELAQMKLEADSEINDDLQEVLTAGVRAKDLVKQILAFSRQAQREQVPTQLGLIAQEALKLIRSSLPTTIDVRQNIQSQSVILSDPIQLHQIVMNLCTNAAYAMRGKDGILEIALTDVELDSDFCLSHPEIQPGAYQKLMVCDTGQGMTADVMNRIFDPFFTTKPKDEGTGLGLSVVHGIVKDLGGTITVYSEPDKGTTFNIYFPIIKGRAEKKPEKHTIIPTGTERILVVDDEKAIIDIIQKILTYLGYAVEARTSSLAALELFTATPDKFDLVITDMTMPQMTGDMLARELMKLRPDLPVILCTGFSENITKEQAETIGIKAFLLKPLLKEEMAHTIRKVLDEAKGTTQE
ncbi:MAG: PAS domain S-box protein [Proteobacteria bacterium]|nr:PAS domain S-box protein [Pseudomonadota bacterium]MBU4278471.1 PAS domain S-box protein [Pseudomonadota bacterium]MBU4382107.1 PAS domain S-box protein [Pseudomonadota bacterium]MCG2762983.1 PAS domain S-box protein [Desulfarculaceae bacterium]